MKKNVLPFLFLAASVFLFAPTNKVLANDYACKVEGNPCKNITADNFDTASTQCGAFCGPTGPYSCITDSNPCPTPATYKDYACTKNDQCSNISAPDYETASGECHALCTDQEICSADVGPCPAQQTNKDYACVKNDQCSNISAPDYDAADQKCRARCTGQEVCLSSSNPCPNNPLAGASVDDLKKQAQGLNKAGFKSPADVISRAIQILLAFIGSIALALYVWSGFLWMTAQGNSEQTDKAQKTMVWTTLGVVMMLASYMLASFLFKSLGL